MPLREAHIEDFEYLAEHTQSRGCFGDMPSQIDFNYAFDFNDKLLAIGGFKLMNKYSAFVWMDWTEDAMKNKPLIYRVIKEWLESQEKGLGLTRIMAVIEPDFPEAIRTAEHLGFHQESVMRGFCGEKNGLMFVRLKRGA